MQNKLSKLIVTIGLVVLAVNPIFVYAQNPPKTTTTVVKEPNTSTTEELPVYNAGVDRSIQDYLCTPSEPADGHDLERCVNRLFRFTVTAGALIVLFMVVFAGYMYITGGEQAKTKAKGYLQNSLTGMAILLGSYLLLYFINPTLTQFKPIQPPIFDAADLPSCEEIGFSKSCVIQAGEDVPGNSPVVVVAGGSSGGTAVACTTGMSTLSEYGVPTKDGRSLPICKSLGPKVKAAYEASKIEKWRATATVDPGHSSRCHKPVNPENGNCVDIGTGDGDRSTARWDKICAAFKQQGGVSIANEIAPKSASGSALAAYATPNCGPAKDKSTKVYQFASDAPSIHVNYTGR